MTEAQHTAAARLAALEWRWKSFDQLSGAEVYAMLAARSAVFVIEQKCLYGDIDGLDLDAWHLFAFGAAIEADTAADAAAARPPLAGYLRVLLPDADDSDIRIGRVLTTAEFRGIGLGNAMLDRAIAQIRKQWPGTPMRLHAQAHLQGFYGAFGFGPVSEIHEEDGIPHVWMRSA
ncbi:MAG TPA: GNAT family N-acetyltransferase [Paraburkholderia sp.]|uniref:GNAT family N-acetyltransferase n=1 Tax=Paraburkholderia sp. TaxID=1926495 RepID=UPI002ED69766